MLLLLLLPPPSEPARRWGNSSTREAGKRCSEHRQRLRDSWLAGHCKEKYENAASQSGSSTWVLVLGGGARSSSRCFISRRWCRRRARRSLGAELLLLRRLAWLGHRSRLGACGGRGKVQTEAGRMAAACCRQIRQTDAAKRQSKCSRSPATTAHRAAPPCASRKRRQRHPAPGY